MVLKDKAAGTSWVCAFHGECLRKMLLRTQVPEDGKRERKGESMETLTLNFTTGKSTLMTVSVYRDSQTSSPAKAPDQGHHQLQSSTDNHHLCTEGLLEPGNS